MRSRLDSRLLEDRNQKIEASVLEARSWKLEARLLDVRCQKIETRNTILYPLSSMLYSLTSHFYSLTSILYPLTPNLYPLTSLFLFISIVFQCNSQSLQGYQQLASQNNPGLQAQYKEFEAALQQIPQVKTLPDPSLSVSAFGQMAQTRVGQQMARFSLSQMFPWFGTLKAQGDMKALMAEASYQEFLDARNQLYYHVAVAYYPLYELTEWMNIEQENIRILESYKAIANVNFRNGTGKMVDVLRVDIMLKDATTSLEILKQKKKPLETRFNKFLNRNESDSIVISDSLSIPQIAHEYRKDSLLVNNPILSELDLKIKASQTSEKVAQKQGLPQFGIGFEYIVVTPRTDANVPQNGQDAYMPMLTVSLPIFRAKYRAAQKEAQIMQESFMLKKQDVTNTLIAHYETTSFEITQQQELIQLYDLQIAESQQILNLLYKAYGTSGIDFEEVLRMQQQLLQYQKMRVQALVGMHIAVAEMDYITSK